MPQIYGKITTETVLQDNRLYDVSDVIFKQYPDLAPFMGFMKSLNRVTVSDPEFWWFNKGLRPAYTQVNNGAGYLAGDTSIVVDDATVFVPSDVLRVVDANGDYGEQMIVTAVVTGTNTITVRRAVGSTSAQALVDNDKLIRVGNAQTEYSDSPNPVNQKAVKLYNYAQTVRTTNKHSRRAEKTTYRAGNQNKEIAKRRDEKTREHQLELERVMLFGERGIENAGTEGATTYTGGIYHWILDAVARGYDVTTNQGGGTLTLAQFETFLEEKAFAYGSDRKIAFCSPRVISVLNNLLRGEVRLQNHTNSYGLNVTTYESPHGVLDIVRHRLFEHGDFKYASMIVDPNQLELKSVNEELVSYIQNVGLGSLDGSEDNWLTDAGLCVAVPESCAFISNIQSAA